MTEPLEWVSWFAWRPVRLNTGKLAWLREVYYRPELMCDCVFIFISPSRWRWEYVNPDIALADKAERYERFKAERDADMRMKMSGYLHQHEPITFGTMIGGMFFNHNVEPFKGLVDEGRVLVDSSNTKTQYWKRHR